MSAKTPVILAVDDSIDDLTLLQMAFRQNGASFSLCTVDGGEEALRYFEGKGKYADRDLYPLPRFVILDLKMPRVSGFDVLERLSQMQLTPCPFVVVMSSSNLPQDIQKAHDLGAFAYHTKPGAFSDLCALTGKLCAFFATSTQRSSPVVI